MKFALLLLLALAGPTFEITDAREKKPSGVVVEAGQPDADGWMELKVTGKPKSQPVLVWPYDGRAKKVDGPGAIDVIVIEKGDPRALTNPKVVAAILAAELLGKPLDIGLRVTPNVLEKSDEAFAKGVGLMYNRKPAEAAEPLARALRERERVMTRIPSDIYPAAILAGQALMAAARFKDASLAYLKALNQRPSDPVASKGRADALAAEGKADAAKALRENK